MAASIQEKTPPPKSEEALYSPGTQLSSTAIARFSRDDAEESRRFDQFSGARVISVNGLINPNRFPNPSPNSNPSTASIALSGQSSVGSGSVKVGKRRSKLTSKTPIKVFSADTANFMAMVQKLTGIPSQLLGSPQTSLLKPLPTRPSHPSMQGLHTLDTSAFFIGDNATTNLSNDSFLSKVPRFSRFRPSVGQHLQLDSSCGFNLTPAMGLNALGGQLHGSSFPPPLTPKSDLKSLLPQLLRNTSSLGRPTCAAASLPSLWDPSEEGKLKQKSSTYQFTDHGMFHEDISGSGNGDTSHQGMMGDLDQCTSRGVPSWESLLMGNDGSSFVDSWLPPSSNGAVGSHASKAKLA